MVKVTPITVTYTILLTIAVLSLTIPTVSYYTNPQIATSLNGTYTALNLNFTNKIYAPTYSATFNSSGGLKASNFLQQFTGLAFMFGAMFQVSVASFQGIPMLSTLMGTMLQYSILPDVNIAALVGLFLAGAGFLLIYFFIASWTKVEA